MEKNSDASVASSALHSSVVIRRQFEDKHGSNLHVINIFFVAPFNKSIHCILNIEIEDLIASTDEID